MPFSRTPNEDDGILVALSKVTVPCAGRIRWKKYTLEFSGCGLRRERGSYIVLCEGSDTGGKVFLLDGKTGTLLSTFDAEKNIEASPAVYGNMIVFVPAA
ncbi:MAG: hypothetical protein R2912_10960 [Eubacteriales bacterium]